MVPFLARWVDLDWLLGDGAKDGPSHRFLAGLGHLRNLVALSPELSARRGTAEGLRRFLETATGVAGFEVDDAGTGRAFHVEVVVPEAAAGLGTLVERIVRAERPAHATYEVHYPRAGNGTGAPADAGGDTTPDDRGRPNGGDRDAATTAYQQGGGG